MNWKSYIYCANVKKWIWEVQAYLQPCQASMMDIFCDISERLLLQKCFGIGVWQGPKGVSGMSR